MRRMDARKPTMDARSAIASRRGVGHCVRRLAAGGRRLAIAHAVVSMVLAVGAQAQTPSCDDFKAVLAARFESNGVRGYSMEAVPAGSPVPSDARVIGTCESGAYKILYRRWGAARVSAAAASAAPVASAAPPATAPDAPPRRAPGTRPERAASAAPSASVPGRAPAPMARSNPGAASAAAVVAPAPTTQAAAGSPGVVAAMRSVDKPLAEAPAPVQREAVPGAQPTLTQRASDAVADHWRWLAALALVVLAGGIWLWRTYFSAYDKDGLPRGPRL